MTGQTYLAMLIALAATTFAAAQQQQTAPVSAAALGGGAYCVNGGSGANAGFIVGAKEVAAIDAKMSAESIKAMLAEIRKVTPNPVKYVVLTHSDGDHVNGLAGFPEGLAIIAHANCAKDMQAAFKDPKVSALVPYLPSDLVTGDRRLNIEGVRIELLHFGPAHTNGDLVVWLPERKIAFVGDLAFTGRDPLIHGQKGGTSFGYAQTLRRLVELDAGTYISGHSDPLSKADLPRTRRVHRGQAGEGKGADGRKEIARGNQSGVRDCRPAGPAPAQPGRGDLPGALGTKVNRDAT